MEIILEFIVLTVLLCLGIILVPILIALLVLTLLYPFANHLKFMQKYYCKIGWHCHIKDYQMNYFDGASEHCTCKWCGYEGMVDSWGNLF